MSVEDELRIYEYLDRISDALTGRVGPQERSDLVERIRHRIEVQRELTPVRRRDGNVERILQQLGPPDVVAQRLLRGATEPELVVPAAGPAPGNAPADEPADGTTAPIPVERVRLRVRRTFARRRRSEQGQPRLTERARSAAQRMWPPMPRRDDMPLEPIAIVRTYALEIGTLLSYTVGTVVLSYFGLLLAVVLTLFSRVWSERDKGVAIALIPAVMLGIGMLVVWLDEGRDRSGTTQQRWDRVSAALGDLFTMWPLVSGLLAGIYLLYRLLIIAQQSPPAS